MIRGFNNLRYDNQMLYARLMEYSEKELFDLSQRIINAKKGEKVNTFHLVSTNTKMK